LHANMIRLCVQIIEKELGLKPERMQSSICDYRNKARHARSTKLARLESLGSGQFATTL
jgi:hypothetical protein